MIGKNMKRVDVVAGFLRVSLRTPQGGIEKNLCIEVYF